MQKLPIFILISLLISACAGPTGTQQPTITGSAIALQTQVPTTGLETTNPVAAPSAPQQANAAPQPTVRASATDLPGATPAPTEPIAPTAAVRATGLDLGVALYPCKQGLCRIRLDGSDARTAIALPNVRLLRGFAFAPNAAQIAYALVQEGSPKTAQVFITNASGANQRGLFLLEGIEDGLGDLSGNSVIGFRPDGKELVVEQQAQLWRVPIDAPPNVIATNVISVTERLPYGVSSTHTFTLSPERQKVLFTATGYPNGVTLYDVANAQSVRYELPRNLIAVGFGTDDQHLIAMRFDPPFDPNTSTNPATLETLIQGYVQTALDGTQSTKLFDVATPSDQYPLMVSNVVSGHVVFQRGPTAFFVFDFASGKQTPLQLPGYLPRSSVKLAFTRQ